MPLEEGGLNNPLRCGLYLPGKFLGGDSGVRICRLGVIQAEEGGVVAAEGVRL